MTIPKEFSGVLIGAVGSDTGERLVGLSILGQATIVVTVEHAGLIFSQLGDLLDSLDYFKDDEKPETKGATCKMH